MPKLYSLVLILIFIFTIPNAMAGNQINSLQTYVDNESQAQINFLKQLVNINSGTNNIAGVNQIGKILKLELENLGFKVKLIAPPAYMKRAPTLIATHAAKQGKKILLIGHLDTVFAKDNAYQTFTQKENKAYGPGVIDDKGGLAIIVYALKTLQHMNVLKHCNITVVLTGDEEDSGKPSAIAREPLLDIANNMDVALDFEPAISLDTATVARRGTSHWIIKTTGTQAHSASIFRNETGSGAIFELARILTELEQYFSKQKLPFNPGMIVGGTEVHSNIAKAKGDAFGKPNVVAKYALAKGDFRYLSDAEKKQMQQQIETIAQKHLGGTNANVSYEDGIPAMSPKAANYALLKKYDEVSERLKLGKISALPPEERGAGDISHIADIVPANLSGLGAEGGGAHTAHEFINLSSLAIQTKRTALLIYELAYLKES